MMTPRLALPGCLLTACVVGCAVLLGPPEAPAAAAVTPNAQLTPGAVSSDPVEAVCRPGYAAARRAELPRVARAEVYARYGMAEHSRGFVIDHRVPLSLGGLNLVENLWPEPKAGRESAHAKDELERALHSRVCRYHTMTLRAAQDVFLGDWRAGAP